MVWYDQPWKKEIDVSSMIYLSGATRPQIEGGWQPTLQSISRIDGLWHVELRGVNFLGSLILKEGGSAGEIKRRLAMPKTSATASSTIWKR